MADRHNRDIDRPRAPLPEPLPVPTVDAHAHMEIVTDAAFDSQEVADVIAEAKSVNVDRIVQVGYSAEHLNGALLLRKNGIHRYLQLSHYIPMKHRLF